MSSSKIIFKKSVKLVTRGFEGANIEFDIYLDPLLVQISKSDDNFEMLNFP